MKYRAYKYRLYPNEEQKVLIAKHLGSCRFIYNYALDKKVRAYQTDKTNLSRFDIQADLPNTVGRLYFKPTPILILVPLILNPPFRKIHDISATYQKIHQCHSKQQDSNY